MPQPDAPRLDYNSVHRPQPVLDYQPADPPESDFGPWLPMGRSMQATWFVIAWSLYLLAGGLVVAVIFLLMRGCHALFS